MSGEASGGERAGAPSAMKILQVLPALEQGGVERGTVEIATALAAAGVESAVASAGGALVKSLDAIGVRHYRLPLASKNPFTIVRNAFALARLVREEGFTLMHVRSRAPAWSVLIASRLARVPFISTFHGLYGTKPRLLKIPYNSVMVRGEKTIAVSECVRSHILANYRVAPEDVVLVHRGADVEVFSSTEETRRRGDALRRALGFGQRTRVITLPGRLTFWKGQKDLLAAASRMAHRDIGILFVGSDQGRREYSDSLKREAARLPRGVKVVFLERSDDMPAVYELSDVVVSASGAQPEAFGRVIPEAQAMGRIVVGTAHGGACETIADGATGFLVPPCDPAALARALDRALDLPPDARATIAGQAASSVRENFSVAKMCERTLALYRELHRCGPASSPHAALLETETLSVVGTGTRRVCFRLGDSGFCAKFYKPRSMWIQEGRHRTKDSIRREIDALRFDPVRNNSAREVAAYERFKALGPAVASRLPEVCEKVFHPALGWGVLETFYTNPDGTAIIPYEFEIARQTMAVREEIYAQARDLLAELIRTSATFYEPGNFHVLLHGDGSLELRLVDFEPTAKTLIPLEVVSKAFRRAKLRRKAVRYLREMRERFGVKGSVAERGESEGL